MNVNNSQRSVQTSPDMGEKLIESDLAPSLNIAKCKHVLSNKCHRIAIKLM